MAARLPPIIRPNPLYFYWFQLHEATRKAIAYVDEWEDSVFGFVRVKEMTSLFARAANDPGHLRWGLELQAALEPKGGNYLFMFFAVIAKKNMKLAKGLARILSTNHGIRVNISAGQFLSLQHLDPKGPEDPTQVDPAAGNLTIQQFLDRSIDNFVDVLYDKAYRTRRGGYSRVLKLTYKDGKRLDVDYLTISDSEEPALGRAMKYARVGPADRILPLRFNKQTTPRLYGAKHNIALRTIRPLSKELFGVVAGGAVAAQTVATAGFPMNMGVPPTRVIAGRRTGPPAGTTGTSHSGSVGSSSATARSQRGTTSKAKMKSVPSTGTSGSAKRSVAASKNRKAVSGIGNVGQPKKPMARELIEEHSQHGKSLHPKIADEAVEGAIGIDGAKGSGIAGRRQGDVLLAGDLRREVTVVGKETAVKRALTDKFGQGRNVVQIYMQVGTVKRPVADAAILREIRKIAAKGIPGGKGIQITIFSARGKRLWRGNIRAPSYTPVGVK